ncbi:MAG: histidine phosphatase family protein [Zavarzinella sp.]
MRTKLYLIRHAATAINLMHPPQLQGRKMDPELHPKGVRQSEATRDFLAVYPLDVIYTSPLQRARQTADIIASPHQLTPIISDALIECDIGLWEGKTWEEIKETEPEEYRAFHADPATHGYAGGENFQQVYLRTLKAINEILDRHAGANILVVSHHIVNRTFLAGVLGMGPARARMISLDNCALSVIVQENGKTSLNCLNSSFHLDGIGM